MRINPDFSFQIRPVHYSTLSISVRTVGAATPDPDHWIKFESEESKIAQFLIADATREEADAIVAAIMAPIERMKREKAGE
jgi:hypothetical protein